MTTDFLLPRPARRCHETGREFAPGERIHSAVWESPTGLVRKDYAVDAWPDDAPDALADWIGRTHFPDADATGKPISAEEMLDWFDRLARRPDPASVRLRYVLCLLLLQRRALKLLENYPADSGDAIVVERPDGDRHETVIAPTLTDDQIEQLEQQLMGLLKWGESMPGETESLAPNENASRELPDAPMLT